MTFDAVGAGWFMLDISLRAIAVAAAVSVLLWLLRIRAANVLHSAWTAVLLAMVLMPVLVSIVPALPVPVPASVSVLLGPASGIQPSPGPVEHSTHVALDATATSITPIAGVGAVDERPVFAARAQASRSWTPAALLGMYTAGVLLLGTRLLLGWSLAAAMIRRARRNGPIRVGATPAEVYQSSEVTVPMTVGALRPVIVLPVVWKDWNADMLAAIVAHEAAHVGRRDPVINLAAHLNRTMFWFHPLAWWLERKLAVVAEHACDEAAARAIEAPRRYAEILVEMADVVRSSRGRFAWQGVGVNGGGVLDDRIHRLLQGDGFARASTGKKTAAGIGCVLAIMLAVACRQQMSATPLRADPEIAQRLVDQDRRMKKFEAARDMTSEQADALEQRLAATPDDFDVREQLVIYYRASSKVAWDKKVPGLRRHALWLIANHPEHDVSAPPLSQRFDPEGFAAAKKLWDAHLARPEVSPFLVYRAANFYAPHDKAMAEQLILRGLAMDPQSAALEARMPPNVAGYQWPEQLSSLYGAALRGAESAWGTYNDLRAHLDQVNSPYARQVRDKMEATRDPLLLVGVGSILVTPQDPPNAHSAMKEALDEIRALGVRYLERALELDPALVTAKATLVTLRLREQHNNAYRPAAREGSAAAEARAEEVLKTAASNAQDPSYSAAIMAAHHTLAAAALREGDRERAMQHMLESVKVPASEEIQYAPPGSWLGLTNQLLKEGERERVVEFLETFAKLTIRSRDRLLNDARAIREGRMPSSYQTMVAREGQ